MGFKSFRLELEVHRDAPPPAWSKAIPQLFEALLDVFAPLDVTYQVDDSDFLRIARVDPTRSFAHEPLWCDEELTRDALTRCRPGLGTDVVTELYDRFANLDPKRELYISAEGALLHRAAGTDAPAWYGRWRSTHLHELWSLSFVWDEHWRCLELKCPLSGYPFTSVRPLVRGSLADGDPAIAAENRALLFPALAKVRGALGFDQAEVEWGHDTADYGPLFPDDRKDIVKRWIPLLAASLVFLFACKKPAPPAPMIAIELAMPGASAETIETAVVVPVEEAVSPFARAIESRIAADHATVLLEVDDLDRAAEEVHRVMPLSSLPQELAPPVIRKTRRDDVPVMWLAVHGALSPVALSKIVRDEIAPELERLPGVAQIETRGLAEPVTVVRPDLDRLDAAGVVMFDVLAALQSTSLDVPGGSLATDGRAIRIDGAIHDVAKVGELVVREANGVPVRLRDLAIVEESVDREGTGEPIIAIHAQDGASTKDIAGRVRAVLAKAPPSVTVTETKSPVPPKRAPKLVVELRGPDLAALRTAADGITSALAAKHITDVVRDPPAGEVETSVVPDRDRAATLHVPMPDVVATLHAITGARVGPIAVRFEPAKLVDLIARLDVRTLEGSVVPLSMLVEVKRGEVPAILRRNRERTVQLSIFAGGARDVVKSYTPPQGVRVMLSP